MQAPLNPADAARCRTLSKAIPIQKGLRTISDEKLMDIKIKAYEEMTSEINVEPLDSAAHETD